MNPNVWVFMIGISSFRPLLHLEMYVICTVVLSVIRFIRFNLVFIWYLVIPFFFTLPQGIINETVYQICIGSQFCLLGWLYPWFWFSVSIYCYNNVVLREMLYSLQEWVWSFGDLCIFWRLLWFTCFGFLGIV